jgi:hypothetical protein
LAEVIDRIQDWYKLNCNGDWEHSYGYSIATLDNPGWTIRIDLTETPLEDLEYDQQYQNPEKEQDWFIIKTKEQTLDIACGPENLKQVFLIFFEIIIPKFADPEFYFELHLPLTGHHYEIWAPVKAGMVNEKTLEIIEIKSVEYKDIKVRDFELIDFNQEDIEKMDIDFKKGDLVEVDLVEVADGLIITPKRKNN